jgi:hypothetical protein
MSVIADALRILGRFFGLRPGPDVERLEVRGKLNVTPEQLADGRGAKFVDLPPKAAKPKEQKPS